MERLDEREQDIFELELAIKWAHGASIMDAIPEVSHLFSVCETALKEKLERLKNPEAPSDPLTLEELREMDGEPVFIKCLFNDDLSSYVVVGKDISGIFTRFFYASFEYYGEEWLAYRRKPEEGMT